MAEIHTRQFFPMAEKQRAKRSASNPPPTSDKDCDGNNMNVEILQLNAFEYQRRSIFSKKILLKQLGFHYLRET